MRTTGNIKAKMTAFALAAFAQLLTLILTTQPAFAAGNIGSQLSDMGREAGTQAITLISDVLQFAVGPVLLAVSVVFLIIKIVATFVGVRRNEDIDIKGLIIAGVGVIVAGLLLAFRIDTFVG